MYYQFTGQPGHGKTVLAIEMALKMKAEADKKHDQDPLKHPRRELYVCNVRDFNHGKVGAIELSPDLLKHWHEDAAFDNAIILVDEAYEHGMFPRRPPGAKVPDWIQQVAKHRHRGIDFIMICQSPSRQMDDFLHDLIEEHYHIRRRFGLPLVNVKRWDRFERNPDKSEPLTTTKRRYPTEIFKLYTSTKYDTSKVRVPWFYFAAGALVLVILGGSIYTWQRMHHRFGKQDAATAGMPAAQANGAPATVAPGGRQTQQVTRGTPAEYVGSFMPRVPGQPWSAPAYDTALKVPSSPPRLFCMASGTGKDAQGDKQIDSCSCLTEQGTAYDMDYSQCITVARRGQYEPFLDQRKGEAKASKESTAKAESRSVFKPASATVAVSDRVIGTFPEVPAAVPGGSF